MGQVHVLRLTPNKNRKEKQNNIYKRLT
jgi:hypothetical protein